MRPVAYFSEQAEDAGAIVGGIEIRPLADIPTRARELGATLALVACAPDAVPETLSLMSEASIRGVLMMTPVLDARHPEGMSVTYFRIPCTLKSLASSVPDSSSCCGAKHGE